MSRLDYGGDQRGGGSRGGSSRGNPFAGFLDKLLERLLLGPEEQEAKIAEDFGEHKTVDKVVAPNGDPGWKMDNGDIYWYTNNNGRPDLIVRVDAQGYRFYNEGNGWTSTPGRGWSGR